MRYHFTQIRMAIINISINNKWWWGWGGKRTLVHYWWECRLLQPLWETVWNFLRKLKMKLPFYPVFPLLGLYPKNPEISIQNNLCTSMFIAALFTIAKCWKQPKCPSASRSKTCGIYAQWNTMQHKERNLTLCNSMDWSWKYYAKWNKPAGEGKSHLILSISGT